jgi:uncharacterized tellurite resistance protein B-like protein
MSIIDLFESSEHRNNVAHFAAIVTIALSDGEINEKEETCLLRFANKLDISDKEYAYIIKNPGKHPIHPPNTREERLERIYDLFKIIYADHYIDAAEENLIRKYAIGLGCTPDKAKVVIQKSIQIFGGGLAFEDYQQLLDK